MERTLIILKPDTVKRAIVGEVISRFERAGFKIVGIKMLQPDQSHYEHHYETIGTLKTRKGDEIFASTIAAMQDGPVIALVLEGVETIATVRKMVGSTEPKSALPGTIRGDYAHISYGHASSTGRAVANVIHASADPDEAKLEINHWFTEEELVDYETVHASFTQPKQ